MNVVILGKDYKLYCSHCLIFIIILLYPLSNIDFNNLQAYWNTFYALS
jgi:hypothetical protein